MNHSDQNLPHQNLAMAVAAVEHSLMTLVQEHGSQLALHTLQMRQNGYGAFLTSRTAASIAEFSRDNFSYTSNWSKQAKIFDKHRFHQTGASVRDFIRDINHTRFTEQQAVIDRFHNSAEDDDRRGFTFVTDYLRAEFNFEAGFTAFENLTRFDETAAEQVPMDEINWLFNASVKAADRTGSVFGKAVDDAQKGQATLGAQLFPQVQQILKEELHP